MLNRRRFLQVGLAGAALLVAARLLFDRAPETTRFPGTTRMRVLDERSAELIAALAPVVLAGGLPAESAPRAAAIEAVVAAFDQAIAGMSPAVQSEIGDLLGLLCFAPARVALAGLWPAWSEADEQAIAAFLQRWRASRFDLFRAGYQALTQLLQAAWYGNPLAWSAIGYSGPPRLPGSLPP
jgi:hypothetical protein